MDGGAASLDLLRAALSATVLPVEIEHVDETGSTNTDLLAAVRVTAGQPIGARLLVAERQTAGRGRLGRQWQATPGASLTFSLAWPLAREDLCGLSLAVGAALAEAIIDTPGVGRDTPRLGLKWPNDLWLVEAGGEGRKLGGVLIETVAAGESRFAVVGVGLNVCEQAVAAASSGVAWVRELDAAATPGSLLQRVAPALVAALCEFDASGFAVFATRFDQHDLLRDRLVRCDAGAGHEAIEGTALGVSARGELRVRTSVGIELVHSGEVSVRLATAARARAEEPAAARSPC